MKFTTSKNKLKKTWLTIGDITTDLSQKSNNFFHWFALPKFQKTNIELYDSGWTPLTSIATNEVNAVKNTPMPSYVDYDFEQDINIPDGFFPFIKTHLQFKKVGTTEAEMLTEFSTSFWKGNFYRSKGDNKLIYQGYNTLTANGLYGQTELDDGAFLESNIKKIWETEIFYTVGGTDFKAVGSIIKIKNRYSTSPDRFYVCSPHPSFSQFDRDTYFKSVADTTITANVVDPNLSTYSEQDIDIKNSETDTTVSGKIFEDQAGTWVQTGIIDTIDGDDISSATITFNEDLPHSGSDYSGYILFWSDTTQWLFGIDGNDEPANLPDITALPLSLPYTSITWKFNPSGHPFVVDGGDDFFSGTKSITYAKNKTDNYKVRMRGKMYLLQPATVEAISTIFDIFNDVYTVVGNTYEKTTENHSDTTKISYKSGTIDVEVRCKYIFHNPLQFTQGIKINGKI